MQDQELNHRLALAIGAALRHSRQVCLKHREWLKPQVLGNFVTSLRRALSEIKESLKEQQWVVWDKIERMLCKADSWSTPGYLQRIDIYRDTLSPDGIDIEVVLEMAHNIAFPNDFDRALATLDKLSDATSELMKSVSDATLANLKAFDLMVDFSMVLESYPELTNG